MADVVVPITERRNTTDPALRAFSTNKKMRFLLSGPRTTAAAAAATGRVTEDVHSSVTMMPNLLTLDLLTLYETLTNRRRRTRQIEIVHWDDGALGSRHKRQSCSSHDRVGCETGSQ
jgi:hypothetical protein